MPTIAGTTRDVRTSPGWAPRPLTDGDSTPDSTRKRDERGLRQPEHRPHAGTPPADAPEPPDSRPHVRESGAPEPHD
ncbi:hypothetical protein FHR84_001500 [Actinopolyspora biskrensis]|uniref:Uncharacterized protein n=1 Tax=Actinopolyspora biskrensis TaxID=1470178 RepID=A0A852YVV2_9ACTN|nr:hypothetical protein [Actinopolyspora biskrensis]